VTDVGFFNEIQHLAASSTETENNIGLIRGYEYMLVTSLYSFVDVVIRSPQALDLPFDSGLNDAWSSIRNRGRDSLANLIRRDSPVSHVFNATNSYWNDLLKTTSWKELDAIRIVLSEWSRNIRRGFRFSYRFATSRRQLKTNPDIPLRPHALDWLWPHTAYIGYVSGIYSDVYSKSSNVPVNRQVSEDWHWAERLPSTRFDEPDDISFAKSPPDSWARGYALSLCFLIQSLDQDESSDVTKVAEKLKEISTWRDLHALAMDIPLEFKAPRKTRFVKVRPFPKSSLRNLMLSPKRGFKAKQLLGILGAPLRIVESDGLSAPINLERLLEGSITTAKRHNEKVRVINLIHKQTDSSNGHSIAVFMPVYTMISNWSTWWVFFDLYYDFGRWEDTESARIREIVEGMLKRLSKDIEIEEYPINKEELLSIVEEPGFVYLKEELARAKNVNWNIRGVLPETVAAEYFGALGYHPIRVDVKPSFLNGRELDIVSIRWDNNSPAAFYVIECKGYSVSSDKELQKQIDGFSEKISAISSNLKQLADEIGVPVAPRGINATFVSLADISRLKLRIPPNIEIWSFEDFINELKQNHVPTWHLRLLRQSSVALTVAFGEGIQKSIFGE
jgi:hypothetical protein